jgi:SAM-dependent methyltransferase
MSGLFEADYFKEVYQGAYDRRNPRYKHRSYLREVRRGIQGGRKYDVITCFDVLEHVPAVDSALAHLLELLKPGGAMVITVPVYDTIVGKIVGRLDQDPTHVHKQSRYDWINRVAAAGFQHLSWKGILRYYPGGPFYLHYCGRAIRRFAPAIMVTGLAPSALHKIIQPAKQA